MLKTKSVTSSLLRSNELSERLNKTLMLSSRQLGWNGILVEQCQGTSTSSFESELPGISDHWLNLPLGHPGHLIQKRDNLKHESIVQKGDSIFVLLDNRATGLDPKVTKVTFVVGCTFA